TPYIVLSVLLSVTYIFAYRPGKTKGITLPPFPETSSGANPRIVIGELHQPRKAVPIENPTWLTVPSRGLFAGTCVFGAIGTGKTSGCIYPFTDQLLGFQAQNPARRIGGLVLE